MTTYFDTDYREQGVGDLMAYIGREGDTPVYDRAGRPMSEERKDRFIAKSERHKFERHMIISPENGNDLSNDELSRETRRAMEEFAKDRPSATYVYSIHRNTEHPHSDVAITGEKTDLYMDNGDIEQLRENTNERMVERDRYQERQQEQEHERARKRCKRDRLILGQRARSRWAYMPST